MNRYEDFRDCLLQKISSAKRRVWLSTPYLTDGEVLASLHIARYRKLDVRVFLDKRKANAYMSRLRNLNAQNIPAFAQNQSLSQEGRTRLVADDQSFQANRDLNFMLNTGPHDFSLLGEEETEQTIQTLEELSANAQQRLVAQAGWTIPDRPPRPSRQRGFGAAWQDPGSGEPVRAVLDASGAYNYDASSQRQGPPPGTATRLPKELLHEKNKMLKSKKPTP